MDLGLTDRVAVVAAASKGLGHGAALALSHEGAKVVLCARDQDALDRAAAVLPGETATLAADFGDPATPGRLVDLALERFGRLDVAVANNGGPPPGRALDPDDAAFEAALNANFLASVRLVRAAVPHMRERRWGRICLVTSISVKQPIPTLTLSNSARAALWGWAKTAAADLAPDGITLNLVCPGTHDTERTRQTGTRHDGPVGDPRDFGKVVAFLCSDPARFVTGTALPVDGGEIRGLL